MIPRRTVIDVISTFVGECVENMIAVFFLKESYSFID